MYNASNYGGSRVAHIHPPAPPFYATSKQRHSTDHPADALSEALQGMTAVAALQCCLMLRGYLLVGVPTSK